MLSGPTGTHLSGSELLKLGTVRTSGSTSVQSLQFLEIFIQSRYATGCQSLRWMIRCLRWLSASYLSSALFSGLHGNTLIWRVWHVANLYPLCRRTTAHNSQQHQENRFTHCTPSCLMHPAIMLLPNRRVINQYRARCQINHRKQN